MTSVSMRDMSSAMVNVSKTPSTGKNSIENDFTSVMSQTKQEITKPEVFNSNAKESANNNLTSTKEDVKVSDYVKEKITQKSGQSTEDQNVLEQTKDTAKELIAKIAEELDVTEEEVTAAMQALGITPMDLMNQATMVNLVVELSGEGIDVTSIMTEDGLFEQIKSLTETANQLFSDLSDALGISKEELQVIFDGMVKDQFVEVSDDVPSDLNVSDEVLPEKQVNQVLEEISAVKVNAGTEEATVIQTTNETNEGVEPIVLDQTESGTQQFSDNSEPNDSMFTQQGEKENPLQMMQNLNANPVSQTISLPTETITSFSNVNTQDILNQFAEYVKVNASAEITEMEIQLNPANLGSINLQIASKNGVITAQLNVSNEAVKQALESQIITLRENMIEQGIKVEAVEVTIQSHEFERNLNDGQNESQAQYEAELKKAVRKNINLAETEAYGEDDLLDTFSNEEQLQVDMMRRNGNSIDFIA